MERREALQRIVEQAGHGEIVMPTGLDLPLRIVRALEDPDCHLDHAAHLIGSDPLIAARVVAVANSASYGRSGKAITSLRDALSRIGLRTARTLAMAVATRQLAGNPSSPILRHASQTLWEHTAHVAALAHVIARRVTRQDPESALFAGIVHELGGFYLISRANDFPGLLDGDPADWVEQAEPEIGRLLLQRLAIPDSIVDAIESLWEGMLALPPLSLGDTLLLANDLAPVPSPLYDVSSEHAAVAPVIDALVDNDMLSTILAESAAEVESLTAALRF
ncbi:HDOD domain-containing protein [Azonexus sp. R2A61]|uniref:HDOD domain-containing protein n=1 Tax=Azonexus sp. R2A61 TaxID=2744443 RepID=UPI001F36DF44|nr:HDOD domain-containing protein [Azonexus sp. R2A61]